MTPLPIALEVQRRVMAERLAEKIAELRRHEAECCLCGDGPTDGQELRLHDPAPDWTAPDMICRACHKHPEQDFTDLPLVWPVLTEASR